MGFLWVSYGFEANCFEATYRNAWSTSSVFSLPPTNKHHPQFSKYLLEYNYLDRAMKSMLLDHETQLLQQG